MPTTGTYVVTLTQSSPSGFNFTTPVNGQPAHSLATVAGVASAVYSAIGACFSLDGGAAVDINGLPTGFNLITGSISRNGGVAAAAAFCFMSNVLDSITASASFAGSSMFPGPYTVSGTAGGAQHNLTINGLFGPFSPLDINGFLTLTINATVGGSGVGLQGTVYDLVKISGTYEAFQFTWTFGQDGDSVSPGDIITVTSDPGDPDAMDLTQVTLTMTCGIIVPITQTANLLTFAVPATCDGDGAQTVVATGNGVQFSGSVDLGDLIVLLINGSGIYTLVPGQTVDELYSNLRDGTTTDVKIPNPTARTGFVGG
jgi:hypothetical protein